MRNKCRGVINNNTIYSIDCKLIFLFPPRGSIGIGRMKWLEESERETEGEKEVGFTRLASFVCECEPLSEEDLQAIEATFESSQSLPNHKTNNNNNTNKRSLSSHSPPRRRRRLPTSLIALQHPSPHSSSPSQGITSSPIFYFTISIYLLIFPLFSFVLYFSNRGVISQFVFSIQCIAHIWYFSSFFVAKLCLVMSKTLKWFSVITQSFRVS